MKNIQEDVNLVQSDKDSRIDDWLDAKAESPHTKSSYRFSFHHFIEYAQKRGKNAGALVEEYRTVKYEGEIQREKWLEGWQDLILIRRG